MEGVFIIIVMIIVVVVIVSAAKNLGVGTFNALVKNGTAARGILLQVAPQGNRVGAGATRFQSRMVTIDVEIPGQAPYVIATGAIIPLNLVRDVLPGATMEIRVDPKNPGRIAIVGPGAGFSPMALLAQLTAPPGSS